LSSDLSGLLALFAWAGQSRSSGVEPGERSGKIGDPKDSLMAQTTLNRRRRKSRASQGLFGLHLLPDSAGPFIKRRGSEAAGIVLGGLALALLGACLSFNPTDPSFNHAGDGTIFNWLGITGAYSADALLQSLGLAGFLLPLLLLGWSWRLLQGEGLPRFGHRTLGLLLTPLLAASCLSVLPNPEGWTLSGGLGGHFGSFLLERIGRVLPLEPVGIALALVPVAFTAFLYTLGLSWGEWLSGIRNLFRIVTSTGQSISHVARKGSAFARRREEPNAKETRAPRQRTGSRREPRIEAAPLEGVAKAHRERAPVVAPKKSQTKPGKRSRNANQRRLDFGPSGGYELPELSFLTAPPEAERDSQLSRDALEKNARLLESVLQDFGVKGEIVKVRPGPVVTRYELEPAPGTKTSRVVGLADDIARSLSAISVRVAVVPGSSTIGIELPNARRDTVYLRELLGSAAYERASAKLSLVLGKDIGGNPVLVDLARMPHLLIAGTTGSGKSVGVNSMILSLLYRLDPTQCKFIMIDPKMLELSVYDDIPHLLSPVVTEPKKAVVALKWTVREMEERYRAMSRLGVRNIDGYNSRIREALKSGEVLTRKVQTGFDPDTGQPIFEEQPFDLEPLPFIVVVVDEMADLMLVAGKDIEMAVQRLAQMARAAGIHLIMATQRPSVDVITGTIKANFPSRISFHVTSKIDSRTILGEQGAEQLLGQGDMLYLAHGGRINRVHGPLVTDQEVEEVVKFLKRQGRPDYVEAVTEDEDSPFDEMDAAMGGGSGDELYDKAVAVVLKHRKVSTSFVQRQLQIGYNRAARLVERMEDEGLISSANHVGKREILVGSDA
jgi:S-DNA-T family DNA segregation ATPase FtsK/SpoIIIE